MPSAKTLDARVQNRSDPKVIIDDPNITSPAGKNYDLDQMESKKNAIQIRFGKMFINHMIEKVDDFKDMLANEIEEIMKKGDYGNESNNEFYGGTMKIRMKRKKKTEVSNNP